MDLSGYSGRVVCGPARDFKQLLDSNLEPDRPTCSRRRKLRRERAGTTWPNEERLRFLLFAGRDSHAPYIATLWRIHRALPPVVRRYGYSWLDTIWAAEHGHCRNAFREPDGSWSVRLDTGLVEAGRLWDAVGQVFHVPGMPMSPRSRPVSR